MTLTWTASELMTGKKFQDKGLVVAFKGGKQMFSSTIDLQWDADLKITLHQTSATYLLEVSYGVTGATAADIKAAWESTGGATTVRTTQAMQTAGTSSHNSLTICAAQSTAAWASGTALTPAPSVIREKLLVTTGAEPSTVTLKWCQNSSSGTSTTLHDYGWAVARRLT